MPVGNESKIRTVELPDFRQLIEFRQVERHLEGSYAPPMSGPDLANPPETMAEHEPVFSSLVPDVRRLWGRIRLVVTSGIALLGVAVFWRSGYPHWRVAAAALGTLYLIATLPQRAADMTEKLPLGHKHPLNIGALLTAAVFAAIALLTGGIYSPWLFAMPMVFATHHLAMTWSPTTRGIALILGAGLALDVVAPDWLVGPRLPGLAWTVLAIGFTIAPVVIHASIVEVLRRATIAREVELRHARDQLMHQACNRSRELEKVSAALSHELKNPLQAIKILVQLSAREAGEANVRERLRVAAGEVERMQTLIHDYLSFSRPFDKLEPQPIELGSIGDEVVAVLGERAAAGGVSLARLGHASVEADPRRVREALHNLVANALDACPRGANVAIEIAETGGTARIDVRDTGRGMSQETLERLGTPFFTTRDEGTGLGVALARAVFTQHGGSLEYQSTPGTGTTATAVLPKKPAQGSFDGASAGG